MWVETSRTVWDETHIFLAWLASEKVQKWLKYAKNLYKLAAQGPKTPKRIAKTGFSCGTDVG